MADARAPVYAVGILLAAVTFLLSQDLQARQSRKQHTIKILFETRLSEEFRKFLDDRRIYFGPEKPVDLALYIAAGSLDPPDGMTGAEHENLKRSANAVKSLLNYYDFLALGINRHDLDREMMYRSVRGIMCGLVQSLAPIVEHEQGRNPRAWAELTALYNDWRGDGPRIGYAKYHGPSEKLRRRLADWIRPV